MDIKLDEICTVEKIVKKEDLATNFGSGSVEVYATPSMITLMENASATCVQKFLDENHTTVGTIVNIKHIKSTPEGMKVRATAKIINVDGNKILFEVMAYNEFELIGTGTHERYIINIKSFNSKTKEKIYKNEN